MNVDQHIGMNLNIDIGKVEGRINSKIDDKIEYKRRKLYSEIQKLRKIYQ